MGRLRRQPSHIWRFLRPVALGATWADSVPGMPLPASHCRHGPEPEDEDEPAVAASSPAAARSEGAWGRAAVGSQEAEAALAGARGPVRGPRKEPGGTRLP